MKMLGLLGLVALIAADAQAQDRGFERSQQANRQGANQGNGQSQAWDLLAGKYDKNKNGEISLEEYPRGETKFKSFDRNGDGVISAKDFESGSRRGGRNSRQRGSRGSREQMMQNMAISILIVPADANKDGTVTEKEWKAHLVALTTKDGGVDTEKLAKSMPQMGRRGTRQGGRQGGQQGQDSDRMAERRIQFMVRMFDSDQDGEIVMGELTVWFAKVDKNKDGILGKGELPAQRQSRQARGQGSQAPTAGQVAPDFELAWLKDKKKTVRLSSFQGSKPVALIFGSYT